MLFAATPARAQDPAGCTDNNFQLILGRDRPAVRDGETINFSVKYANDIALGCNVSLINIMYQQPTATGDPDPVAKQLTFDESIPWGTGQVTRGPFAYTVHFGASPPPRYTAMSTITNGKWHDIAPPYSRLDIARTAQVTTVVPSVAITKVGSTLGGPAPQTVTYTYNVRNTTTSGDPLADTNTELSNVAPTDNLCAPLTYKSGDNGDGKLQLSETWVYTCTSTFNAAGTYTNTAYVCGNNIIVGVPKNVCSPPATWTVTVTPPPAVPQVAVKPASAVQAPCTLSTVKSLSVRAGELTTIKVTAKNVPSKSLVTITLPGGKKYTARTDSKGVALLHVRPPKSGTASIKAAECSDVEKLTVKSARQVVSRRVPQVTG